MIEYTEDWLFALVFRRKGSVGGRAALFAIPCTLVTLSILVMDDLYPGFRVDTGLAEANKSQLWSASTAVLAILLGFRTNRAMARFWEGTGLLHQMRGEWFDSVSCCVTFSRAAVDAKPEQVREFRHTIVRLMSLCHGKALEEIACEESDTLRTIDAYGLDDGTLEHMAQSKEEYGFNGVEVLLHLIQSLITKGLGDGVLAIPPPILSRVYQTLSRGFVNLLNAKKISDTRFPFPYAQLIATLLMLHTVGTPMMISSIITNKLWAAVFTFVPIFGMYSLNFVAVELENPFGDDDNDLPLEHFQNEMNSCLLMLLHGNADFIPGLNYNRCVLDFKLLHAAVVPDHDGYKAASKEGTEHTTTCRITKFAHQIEIEASEFRSPVASDFGDEEQPNTASIVVTQADSALKAEPPAPVNDPAPRPPAPTSQGANMRIVPDARIEAAVSFHLEASRSTANEMWPKKKNGAAEPQQVVTPSRAIDGSDASSPSRPAGGAGFGASVVDSGGGIARVIGPTQNGSSQADQMTRIDQHRRQLDIAAREDAAFCDTQPVPAGQKNDR